jgi:hypothetical protein
MSSVGGHILAYTREIYVGQRRVATAQSTSHCFDVRNQLSTVLLEEINYQPFCWKKLTINRFAGRDQLSTGPGLLQRVRCVSKIKCILDKVY